MDERSEIQIMRGLDAARLQTTSRTGRNPSSVSHTTTRVETRRASGTSVPLKLSIPPNCYRLSQSDQSLTQYSHHHTNHHSPAALNPLPVVLLSAPSSFAPVPNTHTATTKATCPSHPRTGNVATHLTQARLRLSCALRPLPLCFVPARAP